MQKNLFQTTLKCLIIILCIPLHAQVTELVGIQGQKFSASYPVTNGGTTFINVPLPNGEWTVVRGNEYYTNRTNKKMRKIFLSLAEKQPADENKSLVSSMYIHTGIDSTPTKWLDEPCKGEDFIYKNDYGMTMWNQRCLTIRQDGYLAKSDNKVQQITRDYLIANNIKFKTQRLKLSYLTYTQSGNYLQVDIAVWPSMYGFEDVLEGVNSPWHASRFKTDPDKVDFINELVKWAEKYSDALFKSFQDGKSSPVALPMFTYHSKNNAVTGKIPAITVPVETSRLSVPPPVSVPATPVTPARVAAIANVDVPVRAPIGQTVPNQPTQVTTNPIDQIKKTSGNEVWISFNPSISVQERQFCRIVENFRTENALALQSKNQIKVNETYRSLTQSLNSLLPDGKFQGWVMRTVAVDQASDGSAEVLLELPCNIYVGSNACDANPSNYYGTAPEGSRMYTELAKMTVGDFALTSGQFVYTDDKAFDKTRSVASFRYMRTAAHCKAKEVAADTEFFGIKLDVISTIK